VEAETGLRAIVRSKELYCRQGWGRDRWDIALDDVVLDVRVREPDPGPGSRRVTLSPGGAERPAAPTAESVICAWAADAASPEASAES
jgi:hypothetical protein